MKPSGIAEPLPAGLGAHYSIVGGYDKALYAAARYGCRAVQIFTKNASSWTERTVTPADLIALDQARQATGIHRILSHTAYLINLASPNDTLHQQSVSALAAELGRCEALGIDDLVMHPGAHMGTGERAGLKRVIAGIDAAMAQTPNGSVRLLLETTAGQGTGIGHSFEQLAAIIDGVSDRRRLGVCLDTCHVFAAGHDLRDAAAYERMVVELDRLIGLDLVPVVHLNDSKHPLGSHRDRHDHIGKGELGLAGFRHILTDERLDGMAGILETPKSDDLHEDIGNIAVLRAIADGTPWDEIPLVGDDNGDQGAAIN